MSIFAGRLFVFQSRPATSRSRRSVTACTSRYAYCKACHPGAIERRWTQERVLDAMRTWRASHGELPSSYDWSLTHARRRGGEALARLAEDDWPSASVVTSVFGGWPAAREAAASEHIAVVPEHSGEPALD